MAADRLAQRCAAGGHHGLLRPARYEVERQVPDAALRRQDCQESMWCGQATGESCVAFLRGAEARTTAMEPSSASGKPGLKATSQMWPSRSASGVPALERIHRHAGDRRTGPLHHQRQVASSTTAWWRWSASRATVLPARSVRNAWWRQSGNSCACLPVRRVRRTTSRRPPNGLGDLRATARRVVDVDPGASSIPAMAATTGLVARTVME